MAHFLFTFDYYIFQTSVNMSQRSRLMLKLVKEKTQNNEHKGSSTWHSSKISESGIPAQCSVNHPEYTASMTFPCPNINKTGCGYECNEEYCSERIFKDRTNTWVKQNQPVVENPDDEITCATSPTFQEEETHENVAGCSMVKMSCNQQTVQGNFYY